VSGNRYDVVDANGTHHDVTAEVMIHVAGEDWVTFANPTKDEKVAVFYRPVYAARSVVGYAVPNVLTATEAAHLAGLFAE
jgi:hypothetical protein